MKLLQPPLPGLGPSLAQQVLERMLREWVFLVKENESARFRRRANDLIIASLYLAAEQPEDLVGRPEVVFEALMLIRDQPVSYLDELPLRAIFGLWLRGRVSEDVIELICQQLGHHSSPTRGWFHEVAWPIRELLDREVVTPLLFQNIADKILYVSRSAGLLAALYPDKQELCKVAWEYDAGEFREQYRQRLNEIQAVGWAEHCKVFDWMERESRKVSWAVADELVVVFC